MNPVQPKPVVIAAFSREGAKLAFYLAGHVENSRAFAPPRLAGFSDSSGAPPRAPLKGHSPLRIPVDQCFHMHIHTIEALGGTVSDWAGEWFPKAAALVFVSAAGIAVRAIAPHVRDKTTDPAVIAMDDAGQNVISLLSGHIGGGNRLARQLAALTGGRAVVTTATDVHGVEAVDEWAIRSGCAIENPAAIKPVSAAMLEGVSAGVAVTDELFDEMPSPWPVTLWLRPRVLFLGVGCRRGTDAAALDAAVGDFLRGAGKSPLSIGAVASIDRKRDEPAIIDFCDRNGVPFLTYGAEELKRAVGPFSSSQKVLEVTGVDNVCERAAVLAADNGVLLRSKTLYPGIALALAGRAARAGFTS